MVKPLHETFFPLICPPAEAERTSEGSSKVTLKLKEANLLSGTLACFSWVTMASQNGLGISTVISSPRCLMNMTLPSAVNLL